MKFTKRPRLVGLALLALVASILILQKYLELPLDVERKLAGLQPVFRVKVKVWLALVKERLGLDVVVTSARRTFAEQAAQHAADARNPAPDKNNPDVHMQGIALDVNFKDASGNIVLRKKSPRSAWLPVVRLAAACKIARWGGNFNGYPDNVHFDDL